MILADDSILVGSEGSIPGEVSNCWAYDGGFNFLGGTAGSWEKIDKKNHYWGHRICDTTYKLLASQL